MLRQPHHSTSDEAELRCWNRAVGPRQASRGTSCREKVQFNIHKSPFGRAAPLSISSIPGHRCHCPQPTPSLRASLRPQPTSRRHCCAAALGLRPSPAAAVLLGGLRAPPHSDPWSPHCASLLPFPHSLVYLLKYFRLYSADSLSDAHPAV